jgi:aspartate racemase
MERLSSVRRHSVVPLKVIGLLGGMSWESSALYYQIINREVQEKLGGVRSMPCNMYSYDFGDIEWLQEQGKWEEAGELLGNMAAGLEATGADAIVLCTNTMHKVAHHIEKICKIPLLHIVDFTGEKIQSTGLQKIGLLGTRFTMTENFYKQRLADRFGLDVLVPNDKDIEVVHRIIYDELVKGIVRDESRTEYIGVVNRLVEKGAQGIILGCTEIGLLLKPWDVENAQIFDTTELHAKGAAAWAMEQALAG